MITKETALTLCHRQTLYHRDLRNGDDTPLRGKVNGKVKTWKTRPRDFKIPMKHGLKSCFYLQRVSCLSQSNYQDWYLHKWTCLSSVIYLLAMDNGLCVKHEHEWVWSAHKDKQGVNVPFALLEVQAHSLGRDDLITLCTGEQGDKERICDQYHCHELDRWIEDVFDGDSFHDFLLHPSEL